MSSGFATPCSTMRIASNPKTTPRRDDANPGESVTTIGCFPIFRVIARAASTTSESVRSWRTNSTNFMICTGLKKCIPSTRPGRVVPSAIDDTESDDVFVARMAEGPVKASNRPNSSRLISRSSITASMTRSAPDTAASRSSIIARRPSACRASCAEILPRSTPPSRLVCILPAAAVNTSLLLSVRVVS